MHISIRWTSVGQNHYSHGRLYEIRYVQLTGEFCVRYDGLPISSHLTLEEAKDAAEKHADGTLKPTVTP